MTILSRAGRCLVTQQDYAESCLVRHPVQSGMSQPRAESLVNREIKKMKKKILTTEYNVPQKGLHSVKNHTAKMCNPPNIYSKTLHTIKCYSVKCSTANMNSATWFSAKYYAIVRSNQMKFSLKTLILVLLLLPSDWKSALLDRNWLFLGPPFHRREAWAEMNLAQNIIAWWLDIIWWYQHRQTDVTVSGNFIKKSSPSYFITISRQCCTK